MSRNAFPEFAEREFFGCCGLFASVLPDFAKNLKLYAADGKKKFCNIIAGICDKIISFIDLFVKGFS